MPTKIEEKKQQKKSIKKSDNALKRIFKRYNPDKITAKGLKDFFGFVFYSVGYNVEINRAVAGRYLDKVFDDIFSFFSNSYKRISVFLDELTDTLLDDLGEPIERMGKSYRNIKLIIKESKTDKNRSARKEMGAYVKEGMEKHKELVNTLYSYAKPAVCALLFVTVVTIGLTREYAIDILVDGNTVGTVSNYKTLENANKIIENKLVSTDEQTWSLNSSIKMVGMGKKEVLDERQLANKILENSSENIVEATGLYVNGEFAGAVKDATKLNNALAQMKAPYENGDESRKVSFVQDVNVLDGIFFTDSVVPDDELAEKVSSEVSGAKYYTVQSGDSPWTIAKRNGITTSTLYSLNPERNLTKGMWPGDELVVSASVPFLQVKYVETKTEEEEVPFKTKTEKNNSMTLGTSKTTVKGEKGINELQVEYTYIDGIMQERKVIKTTVIKEPVTEVIQQGTVWNGTVIIGTGKLIWPTGGGRVSRGFAGQYPAHNGVDIAGPVGTHIYAADNGVVTRALYTNRGYGVYLIVEHGGYQTLYGHCSRLLVGVGQQVQKGQVIAYMGSTGNSTGPHLHFEVKRGNYRYDPYGWF